MEIQNKSQADAVDASLKLLKAVPGNVEAIEAIVTYIENTTSVTCDDMKDACRDLLMGTMAAERELDDQMDEWEESQ